MFDRIYLNPNDLNLFKGSLVGFFGEEMQVKGYIILNTIFGEQGKAKEIKVRYLFIDTHSSYNMIIGRPTFNLMGSILSTLYLCMKYPFSDGRVGVIQRDQKIAMKCYIKSLKLKRVRTLGANARQVGS